MELEKQATSQSYISSAILDLDQTFIVQSTRIHQARSRRVARQKFSVAEVHTEVRRVIGHIHRLWKVEV